MTEAASPFRATPQPAEPSESDSPAPVAEVLSDRETLLRRALLAVTLALSCLFGFGTSYVILLLTIAAAFYLSPRGSLEFRGPARIYLAAFICIAVLFALDARQPFDLVYTLNFLSLLYYAPIATLYGRAAHTGNSGVVANLALCGTLVGCLFAIVDGLILGHPRAGSLTTDPIRLADTALVLGFLSLIGLLSYRGPRRWIYLAGPLLALLTIFLSGSRGALLAFTPMVIAAAFMLVRRKLLALGLGLACLVVLGALVTFTDLLGARSASLIDIVGDFINGVAIGDEGTQIRFSLYRAGWSAFWESPIIGHGWAHMMPSVLPYLSAPDKLLVTLPHLHNEVLNFAVAGGVVGVAVYFMLLGLPIVACLRTPRDSQFRARMYGCLLLTVSYFVLGLPDTMLSFELHTALYVALTAVLLTYCRDPEPRP